MIDNLQKKNKGKAEQLDKSKEERIFLTDVYNSIMNLTVSTMKPEENISNFSQYNFPLKEKIVRKELNLSIKIEESDDSLEGLIDNIGRAEETINHSPIKYHHNIKKPPETTKENRLKIQNLIKGGGNSKNSNINFNQFNKKIDLNNKHNNSKKLGVSPNMRLTKKTKETIVIKTHSPHVKTVFKSIQFNDKLNINSFLQSTNQTGLLPKRESFQTRSSVAEDKKAPETDRLIKNEVSHKVTLKIPKTATSNHIYNNFNIINNFNSGEISNPSAALPCSQINIVSELSPKTNSARVVQKIEIKKEENNLKMMKVSNSHSVNPNPKEANKFESNLKLRKNYTNTNIAKQGDNRSNATNMNNLKVNLLKTNSNQALYPLNAVLKLNTIKSPSYVNDNNSINMTKRDRAISLTARQVIPYINLVCTPRFKQRQSRPREKFGRRKQLSELQQSWSFSSQTAGKPSKDYALDKEQPLQTSASKA
jgi:hypothetical protein